MSTNDNLRQRLNEMKNGEDPIDSMVKEAETDIEDSNDISESDYAPSSEMLNGVVAPNIEDLKAAPPAGTDLNMGPLGTIDVRTRTVNGQNIPEGYRPQTLDDPVEAPAPEPQPETPKKKMTVAERAAAVRERNRIKEQPKEEAKESNPEDRGEALEAGMKAVEENSAKISQNLFKMQEEYLARKAEEAESRNPENVVKTDDVDDIIDQLEDENSMAEYDINKDQEEDYALMIQRLEESKVYADVEETKELTGPADYIIEQDDNYVNNITDIMKRNGMKIGKKSSKKKKAILDRYINSGPQVSVPLVNSGIWVKMSGAGTDEIIAMNSINEDGPTRTEITKLSHVAKHITGSSIGKMKLSELIEVVSYYDKSTLYYALYCATHPDRSEFSRFCRRCGNEFYTNVRSRDILLNPEEFTAQSNNIKDNVTTFNRLMSTSKLNEVYTRVFDDLGIIVHVKHPSIKSYLSTKQNITAETTRNYPPEIVDLVYSIQSIQVYDEADDDFLEIKNPNEIVEFLAMVKDPNVKYQIFAAVDEIIPEAVPVYGLKKCNCPTCQTVNEQVTYDMEDMLFTQARTLQERATMKYVAENQKRQKMRKEEKNRSKSESESTEL